MIIARDLHKSFGRQTILDGINLHIKKGSIFGIVGRSGAGKSTFLRCVNGIESYETGELLVDGVDVRQLPLKKLRAFRKNVGMVFQSFSLLERLSVYDNVALPLRCWKADSAYLDHKVRELLRLVGLTDKIRHKPRQLSGGQKQRVAIARALSLDPEILLCDEATSALDPKTAQEVLVLLRRINHKLGVTIVMVTHQISVIDNACSDMAIIENGRLDAVGPAREIFEQQPDSLKNFLGEDAGIKQASPGTMVISIDCRDGLLSEMVYELETEVTLMASSSDNTYPGRLVRIPENRLEDVAEYLKTHCVPWRIQPEVGYNGMN